MPRRKPWGPTPFHHLRHFEFFGGANPRNKARTADKFPGYELNPASLDFHFDRRGAHKSLLSGGSVSVVPLQDRTRTDLSSAFPSLPKSVAAVKALRGELNAHPAFGVTAWFPETHPSLPPTEEDATIEDNLSLTSKKYHAYVRWMEKLLDGKATRRSRPRSP